MAPPMRRKAAQNQDEMDENTAPHHTFEGDFFQCASFSWYLFATSLFTLVLVSMLSVIMPGLNSDLRSEET